MEDHFVVKLHLFNTLVHILIEWEKGGPQGSSFFLIGMA